ncbi:hypothetical protein CMI37_32085 [Candidatus Pacearchaeota archaeon]|nr:hypothetical protein [Candidatus Pacearchaeota archaeon]|tara:strand:- start:715 stop:1560 length:846 start_codon:yes stop_codon:yes gene_type:complete
MTDYVKVTGVAAADIVKADGVAKADIEKIDGFTAPSEAAIDWTESLWMDDNLQDDLGDWSGGLSEKRQFGSADGHINANMDQTCVPFLDDSGATKYLKFVMTLTNGEGNDEQFLEVDEGTRVQVNSGVNPDQAAKSDTGVEIDGDGNLVDGQHVIKVGYKHVPAKGSTLYRRHTCVVDVASNVMRAHIRFTNNTGSGIAYPTAELTVSSPHRIDWSFTYDPDTNTWTNTGTATDTGLWHRVSDADVATGPNGDGDGCEKTKSDQYVDADTNEHRIWYFKTG